jgi:hypothetical protein
MTSKRIVIAVSTVLLIATALALGLAHTGQAGGTPQEKGVQHAYVLHDGTFLNHSRDVLAVTKTATGDYQITMKKAVANCAVTAQIASDGNGFGHTEVLFASGVSPETIGVGTYSMAGDPLDRDFFLIIAC